MAKAVLKKTDGSTANVPDLDLAQVQKFKEIPTTQVWFLETTDSSGAVLLIEFEGGRPKK
jgi:hypothetical protein